MNKTPLFTLRPEADPRVSTILTVVLTGTGVLLGCLGFIGWQEGWWDQVISYVFYFMGFLDALMGIFLPRFLAKQTSNMAYDFYDDRLELSDGKRLYLTISYDHINSVAENRNERQKAAGRTSLLIEVDKAALSTQTGQLSKTLNIVNISSRNNPAAQIKEALEDYERRTI